GGGALEQDRDAAGRGALGRVEQRVRVARAPQEPGRARREREARTVVVANAIFVVVFDDREQQRLGLAAPARLEVELREQQANRRSAPRVRVGFELGLGLGEAPATPERLGTDDERSIREPRVCRPRGTRLGERLVVAPREEQELCEREARLGARGTRERRAEVALRLVVPALVERFLAASEPGRGRLFHRARRRGGRRSGRTSRSPTGNAHERDEPRGARPDPHDEPLERRTGSPRPSPSSAAALALRAAISTRPNELASATHSSGSASAYVATTRRDASRTATRAPSVSSTVAGRFVIKLPK